MFTFDHYLFVHLTETNLFYLHQKSAVRVHLLKKHKKKRGAHQDAYITEDAEMLNEELVRLTKEVQDAGGHV